MTNIELFLRGMAIRFMLPFDIHKRRAFPLWRCCKFINTKSVSDLIETSRDRRKKNILSK